jgi:hypothetical protein
LKFIEHLTLFLMSERSFALDNVGVILELGQFKDIHSLLINDLGPTQSMESATKKLLARVKNSYEQNTNYEFFGHKEYVEAKDQDFLKEFNLSPEFNEFRKKYNLSHFQGLSEVIFGGGDKFKVKETNGGWLIMKAS